MSANFYPLFSPLDGSGLFFRVEKGDTLYGLIISSGTMSLMKPEAAIELVMADNPHIKNADLIYPGDMIFIRNRNAVGRELAETTKVDIQETYRIFGPDSSTPANPGESSGGFSVNWLNLAATVGLAGGSGGLGAVSNVANESAGAIQSIISSYEGWKTGGQSRTAHYQFRSEAIADIRTKLGPAQKLALGGDANQQLRMLSDRRISFIDRSKPMKAQATRLKTFGRSMSRGGAALSVVGVAVDAGFTHQAVCTAPTKIEKNRALTGGVGGMTLGAVGGSLGAAAGTAALVFFIGSNPAGWAVGLAMLAGGAIGGGIGSVAGSLGGTKAYDEFGNGYDIVEQIPIEGTCSIWQ